MSLGSHIGGCEEYCLLEDKCNSEIPYTIQDEALYVSERCFEETVTQFYYERAPVR
jgi:hypothetical protein